MTYFAFHSTRVAALLLLAACATDQQADTETWRREISLGPLPVFTSGDPLSLAMAMRLANEQNERIAIGGEDFLQACIARARITANFFPEVDIVPNYTFREKTKSGVSFLDQASLLDVPVRTQLTLFDGFRNNSRADAANLTMAQRRAILLDLRETVVLEVVQAYYRVLRAERRAEVLAGSLSAQQQRVREMAARERFGTARLLDRAQTEAQAARTSLDLISAQNDARTGRAALSLLTGVHATASILRDDFELPVERPAIDALFALAAERRQDLQAAALAAEAARARVEVAFGQYYPSIGVNLDWFLSRDSLPTGRDWTGLITLNLPIFDAGRISADVREAWSQFRQEVLRYSLLRRQILADLTVAADQLATLDQRLVELRRQVAADAEAMRQAEAGVRVGLATNLDRITAEDQLRRGQADVVEGELLRKVSWLEALRLTGALTAGTINVPLPAPTPPRPVPTSPFVRAPTG